MSDFWNDLGNKSGELFRTAMDAVAQIGSKTKDLADTAIEKGKSKAQEMKLNSQLRDTFTRLGESFYEQAVNGVDFADKDELLETITSIKQTLSELNEQDAPAAEEEAAEAKETAQEAAEAAQSRRKSVISCTLPRSS